MQFAIELINHLIRLLNFRKSEDFTRPKHPIIADAYAKRVDDVISVSIQNSHTDPPVPSDSNMANEPNTNRVPYNSRLGVRAKHLTIYSKRELEESLAKTKSESRLHSYKGAKKCQFNIIYGRRKHRRAIYSSISSQRSIPNQLKHLKYKRPSNYMRRIGRQIQRNGDGKTADLNYIHQLLNRSNMFVSMEALAIQYQRNNLNDQDTFLERIFEILRKSHGKKCCDRSTNGLNMFGHKDSQSSLHTVDAQSSGSEQLLNLMRIKSQECNDNCDIGRQTNDHENEVLSEKFHLEYQTDENYVETDPLMTSDDRKIPSIIPKEGFNGKHLSESEQNERLWKLLLPSN